MQVLHKFYGANGAALRREEKRSIPRHTLPPARIEWKHKRKGACICIRRPSGGGKTLSGVMAVLLLAALFTAAAVIVFALVLSFARLSDGVIRAVNQVIKLVAIYLGVCAAVGTGTGRPLLRGMLVGLIYMAVGVMLYAVLTAQHLSAYAYAADILMGVAAGGLIAMLRARKR